MVQWPRPILPRHGNLLSYLWLDGRRCSSFSRIVYFSVWIIYWLYIVLHICNS
jgi:hypothetical protein